MESLAEIIPLIIAAVVPPVVAAVRKMVPAIPAHLLPVILPISGGILTGLGALVGAKVAPDAMANVDSFSAAVTGILVGAAAVGVHQIKKQTGKTETIQ